MKRFDVFPIPPIFGHWVVEGAIDVDRANPRDLAGARAVTPHVYPLSTKVSLLASSYTVTPPGGPAKEHGHAITLSPLAEHGDLARIAASMGARPDDLVFVVALDDKTSLSTWVGPGDRAYAPGLVETPLGDVVEVVQVWRRLPEPA